MEKRQGLGPGQPGTRPHCLCAGMFCSDELERQVLAVRGTRWWSADVAVGCDPDGEYKMTVYAIGAPWADS